MERWTKKSGLGLSAGTIKKKKEKKGGSFGQAPVSLSLTRQNYSRDPTSCIKRLHDGWRKACHRAELELLSTEGFPPGVGESTPFCQWFMNGCSSRCGSVHTGSLKGGRRLCIKGRSWKVQHRGRLHIFTSIAACGRHLKGTSSLKTRAWTFMCSRIYTLHCLCFMCFGSWRELAVRRELFCSLH